MAQQKKFDFSIKQDGEQWNAEIIRRVSARRTSISKRKKGFATEALAIEWAKEQLAGFLENLQAGNKRKAEKRATRDELVAKTEAEKEAAATLYEQKQQAYFEALDEQEDEQEEQQVFEKE
ncbi:DUF3622 domain-containing protein [Psychromonas hadalis]|uniref:DUF3622 domain-containing protein n=1 Tax=Psychromonas hadalis TaxID=211669 RepID=UPI0003B72157|nr:DUF3622 domain-containing protein [Psychromonas hadalis]